MKTLPFFRVLACGVAIVLPWAQAARAQTMPSAKLMMQSWKGWSLAFARSVHSYDLQGVNHTLKQGMVIRGEKAADSRWSARKDGARFLYQTVFSGKLTAAYDGVTWRYLIEEGPNAQYHEMTKSPQMNGLPLLGPFRLFDTYPFTIEEFISNPWIIDDGETAPSIPLYDQYLALSRHLTVKGKETVNGRACYHIHLDAASRTKRTRLPQDVWLAAQGRYFIPWQLQDAVGNVRPTVAMTEGQTYKGLWYPAGFLYRLEMGGDRQGWKTTGEDRHTFTLTNINKRFLASAFQIVPPVGADRMIDGRFTDPPAAAVAAKPTPASKGAIGRMGLLTVGLTSALTLVVSLRRRRTPQT